MPLVVIAINYFINSLEKLIIFILIIIQKSTEILVLEVTVGSGSLNISMALLAFLKSLHSFSKRFISDFHSPTSQTVAGKDSPASAEDTGDLGLIPD